MRLKQQEFISYGSGGWESQDQDASQFHSPRGALFPACRWMLDTLLLCPHVADKAESSSLFFFF